MELQKALENRRSIRKYLAQPVDSKDVKAVIDAAILAPSWKNSQVVRYYVIETADMLEKIKATLPEFNINNVKDAPLLIVSMIVKNISGYTKEGVPCNELGNGWGYYDCGLHDMSLLLKASELGLATLVLGIRDADRIQALLQIPDEEAIVSVIALGYTDASPTMPKRKSFEEITKFY